MGKRILLAEDSLTIQKVFELTFAQSDAALTMVDNGEDAVRLAEETAPDLVVADVSLPGKDGFQVAEELRSSEKTRECPVLILSGTLSPFDEERFRASGARGVLFKPFESRELIDKVGDLLRAGDEAARGVAERAAPPAEEPWDFSDVLEEVEQESGRADVSSSPKRVGDLLPGASVPGFRTEGGLSLGDFDVSLEELDEAPGTSPGAVPEEAPAEAPGAAPEAAHIEGELFTDAPEAVTDLSTAIQEIEEMEELQDLEEVERLAAEEVPETVPPPEHEPLPDKEPSAEREPLPATEPRAEHEPPPEEEPTAGREPRSSGPSEAVEREGVIREQFAARAQEIFERAAAETVERVLWEHMDRIVAEFSEKIRESVEAVAWEVIPPTAEALIREEIARIREQAEKKSH